MDRKLAVIGSGATGCATAAYLTMNGWEVTLCDTEEQAGDFPAICSQSGICLEGAVKSDNPQMPCCITTDFERTLLETGGSLSAFPTAGRRRSPGAAALM